MSNTNVNTAVTTAISKEFSAIARREETISSLNITVRDRNGNSIIERNSAGAIATRIVHFLEKSEKFTQSSGIFFDENGEEQLAKRYYYDVVGKDFDKRLIAVRAVQLSQILIHLDKYRPLELIINAASTLASFKQVAYVNKTIKGAYPDGAKKAHWVEQATKALEVAVGADLCELKEIDGVMMIRHSRSYIGSCISRQGIMHQTEAITKENRRKERVKQRSNPAKDGTSRESRDALTFIEAQGQCINTRLLDSIQRYLEYIDKNGLMVPAVLENNMHVIVGCQELRSYAVLSSEYFYDLRGRIYQYAHKGPNPQAADLSKALCYHTTQEMTLVDTDAYFVFVTEFSEEVIGDSSSMWADIAMIRKVASNPAGALRHALESNDGALPFKKFFTYIDMCATYVEFLDNGQAMTQLGFGPDAKCSGAQIFSILAGCKSMAEACGLITGYVSKPADPYARGARCAAELQKTSKKVYLRVIAALTRDEIKTPFMAIQYGGGSPSLLNSAKFRKTMTKVGVPEGAEAEYCEGVVVEGIRESMGGVITGFIKGLQAAVEEHCEEHDVDYFSYRHIDGFLCTKKGEAEVVLTDEPFIINYGTRGQGVIFGSVEKQNGWMVESRTSGPIQRANFCYYFPVHYVQGIDGVMARKIALEAKKQEIRGYSTIHDQFRSCLNDAPKLRKSVIPAVYEDMFIKHDLVKHLQDQMGNEIIWGNLYEDKTQVVTKEILYASDAYYFE